MDKKDLFKYRSVTACMKESYDFISCHIISILKNTWWAFLIYAILLALTIYFRMPNKALHDWGELNPMSSFLLQTVIYIGWWLSNFLMGGAIWTWINKGRFTRNLIRFSIPYAIMNTIQAIVMIGCCSLTAYFQLHPAFAGLALIPAILVSIPFAHIIPDFLLKEKDEKFRPGLSIRNGLRYFGSIFKMGFLSVLILLVITCLAMVPSLIMGWAQLNSQLGALIGDPLGTPDYFTYLYIIVLTLTFLLYCILGVWFVFNYLYLYGSHKTQEEEMRKRKEAENALM